MKTKSYLSWAVSGLLCCSSYAMAAIPTAFFEAATISGAGKRIAVNRVPVKDADGKVSYKNVVLDFTVDAAGKLDLAGTSPVITAAPALITNGFLAGNYKDSRGNTYTVSRPSVIPGTARTAWSLVFVAGKDATQFSMSWATGPIKGHPNESSITARKITSTAYSWGVTGADDVIADSFPFNNWHNPYAPNVIGAAQAGNQLSFYLYWEDDNVVDGSATLTRCTGAC